MDNNFPDITQNVSTSFESSSSVRILSDIITAKAIPQETLQDNEAEN